MYYIHILPFVATLINFMITDIIFVERHSSIFIWINVVYMGINFIVTKTRGEPIYYFLTWDSVTSYTIGIIITLAPMVVFTLYAKSSYLIKGRTLTTIKG